MHYFELVLGLIASILAATAVAAIKALLEKASRKVQDAKVEKAEKEAFRQLPDTLLKKMEVLRSSQEGLETRTQELSRLLEENTQLLQLGNLFNLYNKQIERYQEETRSRASWSFFVALVVMFFGFAFIAWGGQFILAELKWDHIAAGAAIASIGGSISAFLTKTFLNIHRLSLQQLNRYFRQPVINDHVLMAQRLADNLPTPEARQKSYESIIDSLTHMMKEHNLDRES